MAISTYIRSKLRDFASSLRYEPVTFTSGEYLVADVNVPFKGLIIGASGDIVLRGVDDVQVTLTLAKGIYPLGGIAIVEAGTTATNIVTAY